jgi:hypothetical protein
MKTAQTRQKIGKRPFKAVTKLPSRIVRSSTGFPPHAVQQDPTRDDNLGHSGRKNPTPGTSQLGALELPAHVKPMT